MLGCMSTTVAAARPAPRQLANLSPLAQLRAGRLTRRLVQLFVGLSMYGLAMAMMVRAGVGLDPWDVFHYGVSLHTGWSLGVAVIVVSIPVLLLWAPLRQWPGLGTIANAVWIGVATDISLRVLPEAHGLSHQVPLFAAALVINGLGGALYIGSQLGPGPRDGLMTGLHRRTGVSLRLVRTGIELTVLVIGWLLGGIVGIGTLAYALLIGPLVQFFLPACIVELPERHTPTEVELAERGD
ncbi:putative membrane protein YczE [Calidifontibacter indicus]|uniref:Putative membrane protein YczE n=2 Tax=Calidifontibacter indicus TaxID=419650 RepID=A0A3D9UPW0_9MICO|nr:putative membrane protein YczE [Calidifontibacter indicus]